MNHSTMSEAGEADQNTMKKEEKKPGKMENDVAEKEEKKGENDNSKMDESEIAESSVNTEGAESGDDEESDSDESLPPGLLERPVEIFDQKRERKKITRFSYDDEKASSSTDKKTLEIPKGNGIKLRNHPRVEYQLLRNSAEDLKIIHRFFYGIPGNSITTRKNIREFCGFVMSKDSPQYQKKEEFIGKFTVDNLKWAMSVCDVPNAKGNKDELIDQFMDWCLCPKPQDKPLPEKKKKERSAGKKKKRNPKRTENGDSTSDHVTPAKKLKPFTKKVKSQRKKKPSTDKKAKIKITSPKAKSRVESDVPDSSDEEPLMQKKKSPPTNAEIRKYIENMLKDADLEVLTMKVVFQQVYEQYPEFDLTDRKAFIKETVKKIIS